NRGQSSREARYLARGQGYTVFLTPTETVFLLHGRPLAATRAPRLRRHAGIQGLPIEPPPAPRVVRMRLSGMRPSPVVTGSEPLAGRIQYRGGRERRDWVTDVPTYAAVRYSEVYTGVDVVYRASGRALQFDFLLAPGADPDVIGLEFDGVERREIDASGHLRLVTSSGELRLGRPIIYQEVAGVPRELAGRCRIIL